MYTVYVLCIYIIYSSINTIDPRRPGSQTFKMLLAMPSANTPACKHTHEHTPSLGGLSTCRSLCKYTVHSLRLFMTDLCCCASNTFQAYCGL